MKGRDVAIIAGAGVAIAAGLYFATRKTTSCTLQDFYDKKSGLGNVVYTRQDSEILQEIYENTGKEYRLTVFYGSMPFGFDVYGPEQPPKRSWQSALAGWKQGVEYTRDICDGDSVYSWVRRPCVLEEIGSSGTASIVSVTVS